MKQFMKEHPFRIAMFMYWVLVGMFVYFGFVALFPFKIFEITKPIRFESPVYAGETARYTLHYKKYKLLPAVVSRQLINTYAVTFADVVSNVEVGERCLGGYLEIPDYIKPGDHRMIWTATYVIHFPFYDREIVYRYVSEPFKVYYRPGKNYPVKETASNA